MYDERQIASSYLEKYEKSLLGYRKTENSKDFSTREKAVEKVKKLKVELDNDRILDYAIKLSKANKTLETIS